MLWTSLAFVFTVCLPEFISGQDHPCPKTGSGFYPDPEQCDKYWECRRGKATQKFCPDGLVFNKLSPLYERCQYPFNIDCSDRPYLQEAHPKRHCPRSNGLYPVDNDCSAFWQCNGGLARKIRCQGTLAFNIKTGTCQWPHLVPGCENPDGQPPSVISEVDDNGPTVTTTSRPQPPPSTNTRGRSQSRSRRPQPVETTAAPTETPKPSRSSRGQNRNRQQSPAQQAPPRAPAPAPRAPVPPPPEAAPALGPLPVPFQPPQVIRRTQPTNSESAPEEPIPQNLPLPVPFPPTSGVRRIPNYSQPQRGNNEAAAVAEDKPAEPAPTRSQGPPPRRGGSNSLRGATEPTTDDDAPSDAAAVQPPPVRRVVFRRPVTTTQAAPAADDYNYDDFSS